MEQGTGVFLMPSGSDAEYIPLFITKILNPNKKVVNIVSCNEEVGSGTLDAAGGKLFSHVEPIEGYTDGNLKAGSPVEGLNNNVETVAINARMANGDVINKNEKISMILQECSDNEKVPIVHTVFGSKTGIIEKFSDEQV